VTSVLAVADVIPELRKACLSYEARLQQYLRGPKGSCRLMCAPGVAVATAAPSATTARMSEIRHSTRRWGKR
jgi:hypothetical protein